MNNLFMSSDYSFCRNNLCKEYKNCVRNINYYPTIQSSPYLSVLTENGKIEWETDKCECFIKINIKGDKYGNNRVKN